MNKTILMTLPPSGETRNGPVTPIFLLGMGFSMSPQGEVFHLLTINGVDYLLPDELAELLRDDLQANMDAIPAVRERLQAQKGGAK